MINTKISGSNRLELEVGDIVCNHNNIYNDMETYTKVLLRNSICKVVSVNEQEQTVTVKDLSQSDECEIICKNRCDELCSLKHIIANEKQIIRFYKMLKLGLLCGVASLIGGLLALHFQWRIALFLIINGVFLLYTVYSSFEHIPRAEKKLYRYLKQMRLSETITATEK